jgi:hypothetical protein
MFLNVNVIIGVTVLQKYVPEPSGLYHVSLFNQLQYSLSAETCSFVLYDSRGRAHNCPTCQ